MIMRNELHARLIELPIRYRGLSVINLMHEPLAIAIAPNDPLAKEVAVRIDALGGRVVALLSPDIDLSNARLEEFLARSRPPVARIVKIPMVGQLIDFILHENGVAIVRDNWNHWQNREDQPPTPLGRPSDLYRASLPPRQSLRACEEPHPVCSAVV
jgi:hypothetical protein